MSLLVQRGSSIAIEEAQTLDELERLRPEWEDLWLRSPQATPFQSPAWLLPWSKYLGPGELWVLVVREQEGLIGIAPFVIHEEDRSGEKQLLLFGTGVSDYLDLIVAPEKQRLALTAVWEYLQDNRGRWDSCDFQQLRPRSSLLSNLPTSRSVDVEPQEVCPVLQIPQTQRNRELRQTIPKETFSSLSYYRRRLQRCGEARFEQATLENFDELFESFLQLHQARWQARGQPGVLCDAALRQFHREAAEGLLHQRLLRLYGLRLGRELIAAFYGFTHAPRSYCYLGGFDPSHRSLSPGWLMIGHAIERAMTEGVLEFDFLRGTESYKFEWGARETRTYRLKCSQ